MLTPKTFFLAVLGLLGLIAALLYINPSSKAGPQVVVYTSVDAEFALPLFERFTKETGMQVIPNTDSEASKTTGMAGRLLQLKDNPDGDVFWNSELSFTQVLADKGALEPYLSPQAKDIPSDYKDTQNQWTGFGCRARVLLYNTQRVRRDEVPKNLEDLAAPRWKDRFALAKPLFGTTRSHLVSLVITLGEKKAFALFRAWRDNGVVLAESNGDVRDRVANGLSDIGLTDTDDAFSALDRKKPVDFVVPDQTADWPGAYLVPNTVAMLKHCPHPVQARAFIDFLLKPETEAWLAQQDARQIPVRNVGVQLSAQLKDLKPVKVDAAKLAEQVLPMGERIYRVLRGEEQ